MMSRQRYCGVRLPRFRLASLILGPLSFVFALAACAPAAPTPSLLIVTPTSPAFMPTARPTDPAPTVTVTTPATETPAPSETPPPTITAPMTVPGAFNPLDYTLAQVAGGLQEPVFLTHAGDGSGRLFIVEQPGVIRILQDGALSPEPFLDITGRVNDRSNEQGLLGLAFHPQYAANGWFFVNYTDAGGDTVIARFQVSSDPDRADPASETVLLTVDQPYPNHNGGDLAFGPDGYLYIGLGDGGSANDPQNNAQNLESLLGKLLRIDVNAPDGAYAIPPDNPFAGRADARPEIWAWGLRNPWRFSFDRATGDLYIADVGQNQIEEVNFQPAGSGGGENYGWRPLEGTRFTGLDPAAPADAAPPVAEYTHAEGGCSVTGGYVYRGQALPALRGVYLFADYCTGIIWSLARDAAGQWQRQVFGQTGFLVSSFGEDAAGELYLLGHRDGGVYQLVSKP